MLKLVDISIGINVNNTCDVKMCFTINLNITTKSDLRRTGKIKARDVVRN